MTRLPTMYILSLRDRAGADGNATASLRKTPAALSRMREDYVQDLSDGSHQREIIFRCGLCRLRRVVAIAAAVVAGVLAFGVSARTREFGVLDPDGNLVTFAEWNET